MKLKEYLHTFGVRQNFIATESGISINSINAYVLGKKTPTIEFAYKIELATNGQVTLYDWLKEASIDTDTNVQHKHGHDRKKRITKH